jgi:hypothetical protein
MTRVRFKETVLHAELRFPRNMTRHGAPTSIDTSVSRRSLPVSLCESGGGAAGVFGDETNEIAFAY